MSALITGQLPYESWIDSVNVKHIVYALVNVQLTIEHKFKSVKYLTQSVSFN